jgi:hypothetical protein
MKDYVKDLQSGTNRSARRAGSSNQFEIHDATKFLKTRAHINFPDLGQPRLDPFVLMLMFFGLGSRR